MPDALPTWDEALSAKPQVAQPPVSPAAQLPTWDEAMMQPKPSAAALTWNVVKPYDFSEKSDAVKQFLAQTSVGRVMSAFGHGFGQDFGDEELGFSEQTKQELAKAGIYGNAATGQTSLLKSFDEAIMTPTAMAADAAWRGLGAAFGGVGTAVRQAGKEIGAPQIGKGVGEMIEHPEAFLAMPLPIPEVGRPAPEAVTEARSSGVIGEGEAGYFETKEPTLQQTQQRQQAAQQVAAERQAPLTIHEQVRRDNPELFDKYDALTDQRDNLRQFIQQQHEAEARQVAAAFDTGSRADEIADLQAKVNEAKARGASSVYEDILNRKLAERDTAVENARSAETPQIAKWRKQLQGVDYQMRDMAADVSQAYRDAQARMPETAQTSIPPAPETAEAPQGETIQPEALPQFSEAIISDVSKKLIAAGRPQEEADAAAQLVAAHYQARAERFGGKLGTAQEMYERDGAAIRAGKGQAKARELAQSEVGKEPINVTSRFHQLLDDNLAKDKAHIEAEQAKGRLKYAIPKADVKQVVYKIANELGYKTQSSSGSIYVTLPDGRVMRVSDHAAAWNARSAAADIKLSDSDIDAIASYLQQAVDGKELAQTTRGKIRLATSEAKATITLMKSADASTFIHETGHHWLDELMKDAARGEAPYDLKSDAATVRNWLNLEDGEELTRRAHEKFARGFERYMMEGVAPNRGLATVFAKFRAWLTKIYQTVDKLRSPINKDIRDVFARLLSNEPESIVIAEEPETEKMIGGIPEEGRDAALETGSETATAPSHPEIAPEGEPKAAAAGKTQPEKKPLPIASETKREPSPEELSAEKKNPSGIVRPKPELIDKAGNIRLDLLTENEDVRDFMRQEAELHPELYNHGVVSDQEVSRLADAMGIDKHDLNLQKLRDAARSDGIPLAVRIRAGRKLLLQSADDSLDVAARLKRTGSPEDELALAQARNRHLMIAETISDISEEWGRAGRAFRDITGEQARKAEAVTELFQRMTGKTPDQIRKMAAQMSELDTPEKVSKFIQDSTKPSFGDMALEYWINCLTSGLATHSTYIQGNMLLKMWQAVPERLMTAAVGKVHALLGHESSGIQLGEAGEQAKAFVRGLPSALEAAGRALKTGATTLLPGENVAMTPFQFGRVQGAMSTNELKTWRQVGGSIFGLIKGLPDAIVAGAAQVKAGFPDAPLAEVIPTGRGAIPNIAIKGVELPVGDVLRLPSRMIGAIHSFHRSLDYTMEKSALAYRQAANEGVPAEDFAARVAELGANPTEEMMKEATVSATKLTLMGKGGKFTGMLSGLTNTAVKLPLLGETRILKFIDPFVHVSSNIIEQGVLERSPLGFLSGELRNDLLGKNGAAARDIAQGRMLAGTALGMLGGTLFWNGFMSDSGPSDPHHMAMWRLAGNQPHSIRVGETWYDIHRLGPLGMLLGVSADMASVAHAMSTEDGNKVASQVVHAFTQNILDESFMRGPADLIKAVTDSDRYGEAYVRTMASSFIPFSVGLGQMARAVDPYTRQARTTMDAILAKIPYESQSLFPRRDIWGEPIPNSDVAGIRGLSAIYETRMNKDPVNQTLLHLGMGPGQPARKIRGVQLTDAQYDEYSRIAGKLTKMRLNAIVGIQGFPQLPAERQRDIINKIIESSRERARVHILMKYPDVMIQAMKNKRRQ